MVQSGFPLGSILAAAFPRALSTRLFIAAIGSIVLNLSATSVTVATAALMHEFSAPLDIMQWSVTGHLLAMTLVQRRLMSSVF